MAWIAIALSLLIAVLGTIGIVPAGALLGIGGLLQARPGST